jgi:hypothetical protein
MDNIFSLKKKWKSWLNLIQFLFNAYYLFDKNFLTVWRKTWTQSRNTF